MSAVRTAVAKAAAVCRVFDAVGNACQPVVVVQSHPPLPSVDQADKEMAGAFTGGRRALWANRGGGRLGPPGGGLRLLPLGMCPPHRFATGFAAMHPFCLALIFVK